jgi:Zn-dependent oligopeptidase
MSKAPDFAYTPERVSALSTSVIKELEEKFAVLAAVPAAQRNFRNTLLAFEAAGVMNPETGTKYRELILAPGRSYDEAAQVAKFLGRPAGEEAFLKSIDAA